MTLGEVKGNLLNDKMKLPVSFQVMEHNPLKEDGILGFDIIKNNCIIDAPSDKIVWIDNNEDVPIRYRSRKDNKTNYFVVDPNDTDTNDNNAKDELVSVENDLINFDDDSVKNVVDASRSLLITGSQEHGTGESKGDINNDNLVKNVVDASSSLRIMRSQEHGIGESKGDINNDNLVKNVVDASSSLRIMRSQEHGIGESKGDIENHSSLNRNQKRNVIEGSVDTYGSLTNTVNKEDFIKESEFANSSILGVHCHVEESNEDNKYWNHNWEGRNLLYENESEWETEDEEIIYSPCGTDNRKLTLAYYSTKIAQSVHTIVPNYTEVELCNLNSTVIHFTEVKEIKNKETNNALPLRNNNFNVKVDRYTQIVDKLNTNPNWSTVEKDIVLNVIEDNQDLFFLKGDKLSYTGGIMHRIITKDNVKPICQRNYRLPKAHKDFIDTWVVDLLKSDIIQPSDSPWNNPLLAVNKKPDADKTPELRTCLDSRALNEITIGDAYPIPRIDDILDQLSGTEYFTTLDLASGYHQVLIHPDDRAKTAFSTAYGHYEFKRMPFGLKSAPATFQRLMNQTLYGLQGHICFVYLDDVVIIGKSLQEHLENINKVFERLRQAELKLKTVKCFFLQKTITYLGYRCSINGLQADPEKIVAIEKIKSPVTVKEVQSFMGMVNYYRRFIPSFSTIAAPIVNLTRKNVKFLWNENCQQAFDNLKAILCSKVILQHPNFLDPFEISCDASQCAIGAVLSQNERPVAYASRTLSPSEIRYSTIEKELLAVAWAVKYFRTYVYGTKFTVFTDHKPLLGLHKSRQITPRLLRLFFKLSEYDIKLVYKPGIQNNVADALSRLPTTEIVQSITTDQIAEAFKNITPMTDKKLQQLSVHVVTRSKFDTENKINDTLEDDENITEEERNLFKQFFTGQNPVVIKDDNRKCQIIKTYHDSKLAGHRGINSTYQRIRRFYKWFNMRADIAAYVKSCDLCQRIKGPNAVNMRMQIISPAEYPFQKVYLDVVGPLEITFSGNKYILTVLDDLSRYMNAYPIPNQEAATICEVFVKQILNHHKTPQIVLTDQGSNFTSEAFCNLLKLFHIKKITTTPYHPQANGGLERAHRPMVEYLKIFCRDNPSYWDDLLPYAMYVHNNNVNRSTGISPNDCIFGYISEMPQEVSKDPGIQYNFDCMYHNIRHQLYKVWKWVQENQLKAKELSKIFYDKNVREIEYKIGDKVFVRNEAKKGKLCPLWLGPYAVARVSGPVTTVVKIKNRLKKIHNNRLKPYVSRKNDIEKTNI